MDKFYIAPYDKESGLDTSVKPFLIPDTAFSELNNAYVFRGRVRKRFGARWFGNTQFSSRLRVNIGTTAAGTGNFSGFTPGAGTPIVTPAIGQAFSIGTAIFTVNVLGTGPAANMLRSDGVAMTATFDSATGAVVINGATPLTTVYYYPALPVMGLISYETGAQVEYEPTIAFDTKFSYQYNSTTIGWERITGEVTPGASIWTGNNAQFFWGASYNGANAFDYVLFVTNYNQNEPNFMRVYNGTNWDNFRPQISSTATGATLNIFLVSALIFVPFKNRLLAFNTWEAEDSGGASTLRNYQFRVRWSAVGSALATDAWRQDIPGQGSGLDCPVNQAIITVEFIKDRLIVYFEESTWELVYTGNQIYPFAWQQINTELGAESTFSVVPFDKVAIGVGNVGIHACNGANVERIDDRILDQVFKIHQNESGIERVYGIRDYFVEMVYWAFPSENQAPDFPYPNRVLVYNYKANTWAFNDDSITVFGYFQPTTGITWDSTTVTWDMPISWDSGSTQALFRQVIAGNQEGYTFIVDADEERNAAVLQITDISVATGNVITITSIDHNFTGGEFIYISGITGTGNLTLLNDKIFKVYSISSSTQFTIFYPTEVPIIAGTYSGGGLIERVSQPSIFTKEYNFYQKQGMNASVQKVEFMVDSQSAISQSALTVNYFSSTSQDNLLEDSAPITGTGCLLGTGMLDMFPYTTIYPYEQTATRLWRPVYLQAVGEVIQLQLTMSDTQMMTVIEVSSGVFTGPALEDFEIHVMCFFAQQAGRLQ